jgi:hypothetical protein
MRRGILLIVVAPLIFVLSMLFLANALVNFPESLLYKIGKSYALSGGPPSSFLA